MMKADRKDGFTLMELLIALVILAVGLLAMAKMQMSSIRGNAFGGRMTTAIALAQDQMEEFMNQDLEAAGAPFDSSTYPWPSAGNTKLSPKDGPGAIDNPILMGVQYNGYAIAWRITANSPIDEMAELDVQVSWPGGANPVNLTTFRMR